MVSDLIAIKKFSNYNKEPRGGRSRSYNEDSCEMRKFNLGAALDSEHKNMCLHDNDRSDDTIRFLRTVADAEGM